MTLTVEPGSPEWYQIITPSKVAAILGVSRFESPYRLWHRMKGLTPPEAPKEIFDIGHDYEPAAANRWLRKNPGWRLSPGEVQVVVDPAKFGFPAAATLDRRASRGRARRAVEFKTARSLEEWGDELTDECPADYAAQVMAQMLFTGWIHYPAHLLVLTAWFGDHVYEIPFDKSVAAWIIESCQAFWESLAGDVPPDLDDTVPTYECVRQLHPDIDGTEIQYDAETAWRVLQFAVDVKANEQALRGAKTALLDAMGNAKTAQVGGIKLADRRPNGHGGVSLYLATKNLDEIFTEAKGQSA